MLCLVIRRQARSPRDFNGASYASAANARFECEIAYGDKGGWPTYSARPCSYDAQRTITLRGFHLGAAGRFRRHGEQAGQRRALIRATARVAPTGSWSSNRGNGRVRHSLAVGGTCRWHCAQSRIPRSGSSVAATPMPSTVRRWRWWAVGAAPVRGRELAFALARDLVARGLSIVSGLAYGIDAAAHRGRVGGAGRGYDQCLVAPADGGSAR